MSIAAHGSANTRLQSSGGENLSKGRLVVWAWDTNPGIRDGKPPAAVPQPLPLVLSAQMVVTVVTQAPGCFL